LYFLFSQAANDGMDALKYAARRQQMVMPDINLPTTTDSTLDSLQLDPVSIMYTEFWDDRCRNEVESSRRWKLPIQRCIRASQWV
jgi:hypothetical protein